MTNLKGKVRARDHSTSWEAASRQTDTKVAKIQAAIYETLREHGPMIDEEILVRVGYMIPTSPSGIRTRRHELEALGWVTAATAQDGSIRKARTMSGSPSIMWRHVNPGEPLPERPTIPPRATGTDDERHERGMRAARKRSQWETGEPRWADIIVRAYLEPDADAAELREEMFG